MTEIIKLNDETLVDCMIKHIKECDGNELARLAEEMFGGKCYEHDGKFIFEIDEILYNGGLD